MRIATVSEYGVAREAVYSSAVELATAIVDALPASSTRVAADVRARSADGSLLITTSVHMQRQRAAGMLHCGACGLFFSGEAEVKA